MGGRRRPGEPCIGHKNLDNRARDQVYVRVRSTGSASAATTGDPDCPSGETPVPEHCLATPNPMAHLRTAAGSITRRGGGPQGSGCRQLPGWPWCSSTRLRKHFNTCAPPLGPVVTRFRKRTVGWQSSTGPRRISTAVASSSSCTSETSNEPLMRSTSCSDPRSLVGIRQVDNVRAPARTAIS